MSENKIKNNEDDNCITKKPHTDKFNVKILFFSQKNFKYNEYEKKTEEEKKKLYNKQYKEKKFDLNNKLLYTEKIYLHPNFTLEDSRIFDNHFSDFKIYSTFSKMIKFSILIIILGKCILKKNMFLGRSFSFKKYYLLFSPIGLIYNWNISNYCEQRRFLLHDKFIKNTSVFDKYLYDDENEKNNENNQNENIQNEEN